MALVEIVNFHCPAIYVPWVAPSCVETDSDAITPPSAARLHACGSRRQNANKFLRVRQNALAWFKDDYWVVGWNIRKRFTTRLLAPFFMKNGFLRFAKVAVYFTLVKWIIDSCWAFTVCAKKIMAKRHVDTAAINMFWLVRMKYNMAILNGLLDFEITINACHLFLP